MYTHCLRGSVTSSGLPDGKYGHIFVLVAAFFAV